MLLSHRQGGPRCHHGNRGNGDRYGSARVASLPVPDCIGILGVPVQVVELEGLSEVTLRLPGPGGGTVGGMSVDQGPCVLGVRFHSDDGALGGDAHTRFLGQALVSVVQGRRGAGVAATFRAGGARRQKLLGHADDGNDARLCGGIFLPL